MDEFEQAVNRIGRQRARAYFYPRLVLLGVAPSALVFLVRPSWVQGLTVFLMVLALSHLARTAYLLDERRERNREILRQAQERDAYLADWNNAIIRDDDGGPVGKK